MNTIREARPTEYKGVQFRSKSEAIIARAMELAGWHWIYEPNQWRTSDGWVPDFWVIAPGRAGFNSFCLEYKPQKPTQTYMEELKGRILSISDRLTGHGEALFYGSPFDALAPRGAYYFEPPGTWTQFDPITNAISSQLTSAKNYRFDLEAGK